MKLDFSRKWFCSLVCLCGCESWDGLHPNGHTTFYTNVSYLLCTLDFDLEKKGKMESRAFFFHLSFGLACKLGHVENFILFFFILYPESNKVFFFWVESNKG